MRRRSLVHDPLARALLISLGFHLAVFGTLELGNRFEWMRRNRLAALLREALLQPAVIPPVVKKPPSLTREVPLVFVDVDPAQSTPEPPKDANFYSALNSKAANPKPDQETNVPKIDGQQAKVPKTFDTLQPQSTPPKPQPQPQTPPVKNPEPEVAAANAKPQGGETPGDLAMAKPSTNPRPDDGKTKSDSGDAQEAVQARPRTLAAARLQKGLIVGQKMKQEGGVKRRSIESSLDVRATPFGAYDAAIIAAVQQKWYDLLDERKYAHDKEGKVVLKFKLIVNGRITDMQVLESDVGELLTIMCERAVIDPAPYAPWPSDMRRLVSGNYREVRFTFYY